jgi:hypothetical protein
MIPEECELKVWQCPADDSPLTDFPSVTPS